MSFVEGPRVKSIHARAEPKASPDNQINNDLAFHGSCKYERKGSFRISDRPGLRIRNGLLVPETNWFEVMEDLRCVYIRSIRV